ncbi:hypothetical protein PGKDCPLP_03256 [Stenotrophomonas maltophilia]|nr:hypothetical protein PGKDCPLP_03256 [Stenotrophomonas maltophilia]
MRASAGGHSSNAQPEAARSSFWRAAADWAMMETQARRVSAIQHDQVRSGFLSRCSYVAPSPQRRSPATWPRKELTYCPIYGFKPSVICTKDLTRELFCFRGQMHRRVDQGRHLPTAAGNCRRQGGPGCRGVSAMDGATEPPWTDSRRPLQPGPPRHSTESQLLLLPLQLKLKLKLKLKLIQQVQGCKPCRTHTPHTTGILCCPSPRYGGVAITISASE